MLVHLTVRDFAIVQHLEIEIASGMTVITGETGAGKSILVDALGAALGERVKAGMVRAGCERADIVAVFDIADRQTIRAWLDERSLDSGEPECILRRVVNAADTRSRAFVNGNPVPVQTLRDLGNLLLDIHGQHEHQSLVKQATQRQMIDDYAGHSEWLNGLAMLCRRWKAAEHEIHGHPGGNQDLQGQRDLLQYQIAELKELALEPGEIQALTDEQRKLNHRQELLNACARILDQVSTDTDSGAAALHGIESSVQTLAEMKNYDTNLGQVYELFDVAAINMREGVTELGRYMTSLDHDPDRLDWIEKRLSTIHELARKHRVRMEQLPDRLQQLEDELAALTASEARMEQLQQELRQLKEQYEALSKKLSASRMAAARTLGHQVTAKMQELGMKGGRFQVAIRTETAAAPVPAGRDHVEFLVNAHAGQAVQALAMVASGGELSRIALAIQAITAGKTGTPTLIFDEVDAGIGGRTADIVGQHLRLLGEKRQVLCITHLPQVASRAHHHIQITKYTSENKALANMEQLSGERRIEEIARMLGGADVTPRAIAHAREMLQDHR